MNNKKNVERKNIKTIGLKGVLLCALFLSSIGHTYEVNLSSPRETFKTFLKNMVKVKKGVDVQVSYERAAKTLDLSEIDTASLDEAKKRFSDQLISIFDRLEKVNYENIPASLNATSWIYYSTGPHSLTLKKQDNDWKFSSQTLRSLDDISYTLKDKKTLKDVEILDNWRIKLRSHLPDWSLKNLHFFELWQAIGLMLFLIISFIVSKVIFYIFKLVLNQNFKILSGAPTDIIKDMLSPLSYILLFYITLLCLPYLDFSPNVLAFLKRSIYIVTALFAVWFGHRFVQALSYYLKEKATLTESKFDDIVVPLVTKTSFVLVYIFGILLVATSLTFNVAGMIAGLGIGGLAFAFAAKDTLANFFGSIMLVLDRPFDIGDVIKSGDLEGTVVEVGFRSTRIRTFYDSIITVANGDLVNRAIDNLGKRQYRRLNTNLGVEYDTPPEKIEAFCEGIRQLILSHRWTRKDYFNVYFSGYGDSSLNISLMVFWQTDDYTRELTERHRLMIDILRLSKELEINFAFPTTTVHLFNESEKPVHKELKKYIDEGIEKATKVSSHPFSLKNPRSNKSDKQQFGENDFGL